MGELQFDQVNIVVSDVAGAVRFLRALGVDVPALAAEWAEWETHHVELPTAGAGFDADVDSAAYARHWGGVPDEFTGVVLNLRTRDRNGVDTAFGRALDLGAEALRGPYDAFWGARYAAVRGPGPLVVGLMSPADPAFRHPSPAIADFAQP